MRLIASQRPPTEPNIMALLALNGVLLGLLAVVTLGPTVAAQNRGRGDYMMVAGRANGADSSVVYIVDTANQELIAVTYSQSNKRVDGIGYRNLAADSAGLMRGRTRPGS